MLDHSVLVGTTVNDRYYCAHKRYEVRPAVRRKQPELLERGVILVQNNATPHRHRDVQNLCNIGARRCWHVLPTLQISSIVIIGLQVWKKVFGRRYQHCSRPLYIVWARTITQLQLMVYYVDGKSVWAALMIMFSRGRMCHHSGIKIALLSRILLL